jgi:hypothetical protein
MGKTDRIEVRAHPLIPAPTGAMIAVEAQRLGLTEEQARERLLFARSDVIARMEAQPLRCGWEPSIWHVADALIDFPFCDDTAFLETLKWRLGLDWEGYKKAMRAKLRFEHRARMLLIMGGTQLHPDAGLALGYHREKEAYDVDSLFQQFGGKGLGHHRIIEHDGNNGMIAGLDVEAGFGHFGAEVFGVVFQFVSQLSGFAQQVHHRNGCTNNAGG